MGITQEDIKAFSKGAVTITHIDPEYAIPKYEDESFIRMIADNAGAAAKAVEAWHDHVLRYMYFVQFRDDDSRQRVSSLHTHTDVVSTLCDARLGMDPTELWRVFDDLLPFEAAHSDYRADPERDKKWDEYAAHLENAHNRISEHLLSSKRLTRRMVKQISLQATGWSSMPSILPAQSGRGSRQAAQVFYSYSHKDEELRAKLDTHLSLLKRQGVISGWHDRKILAGSEWKNAIDSHLEMAEVVLLLVSADFLDSDYCYDIEMRRAIGRHSDGSATVIPIILRACDWTGAPFAGLQALPTDAKPVTSWSNPDEAFTDIAKGIRRAVESLSSQLKQN
jgi:hypothetical protein